MSLPKFFDVNVEAILHRQPVGVDDVTDDISFTFCQFFQFLSFKRCLWLLSLLLLHLSIPLTLREEGAEKCDEEQATQRCR